MERILGLDVGDKTIGVAVSDLLQFTAQGVKTIRRIGRKKDLDELATIIEEYDVKKIVIGLPKNMNNTIGPQGEKTMEFGTKIKNKFKIDVVYVDERMTTMSAQRVLIEGDVSRKKRKDLVDKVAATYILQTYLDMNRKEL